VLRSIQKRLRPSYYRQLAARLVAPWVMKHDAAVAPFLYEVLAKSGSTGCSWVDYYLLYREVLRSRPACVLELGSGVSTVVLAAAARRLWEAKGHRMELVSMEEGVQWHAELQAILPAPLCEHVRLTRSDVVEEDIGGELGRRYATTPPLPYELVFIDGPVLDKSSPVKQFDSDYLYVVLRSQRPVKAFLDHRMSTCEVYARFFPKGRVETHPSNPGFTVMELSREDYRGPAITLPRLVLP
jgi:hypothetical protein